MYFFQELKHLLQHLLSWFVLLFLVASFFFVCGPRGVGDVGILESSGGEGYMRFVPTVTEDSFAVRVFEQMRSDLMPQEVSLIVTSPFSAFFTQIKIALLLAFFSTFPFFLLSLVSYLFPALRKHERRTLIAILIPSALLFLLGAVFAYIYVLPPMFLFLYGFAPVLEAVPYFTASEFVGTVAALMSATGTMFILPVVMVLLTRLEAVSASFWAENWRYALISSLIFTAIVTPDGSGITMALLSGPLMGLYVIGGFISTRVRRQPA